MKSKKTATELTPHPFTAAAHWDLEQLYERRPRTLKKKTEKEHTRLPIKTATGVIQQVSVPDGEGHSEEEEWYGIDDEVREEGKKLVEVKQEKPKVPERQRIIEAKERLATIATSLSEDPEESTGLFKKLQEFSADYNSTIVKLALATQLAVYTNVIPGYRIRALTEEEQKAKVTKEVKKLRTFEQALVSNYQSYVESLGKHSRASKTNPTPTSTAIGKIAVNCVCSLISHVPHFNFRTELLKILIERLSVKTVDETFTKCRTAIEDLFRNDEDGNASLEAVQLLTKMIKAKKYNIDESVLNTFLSLRLLSELDVKASNEVVDNPRKRRKKDREFRTKKQRKLEKENKEIQKEMKEADATISHEEREKVQSETLKLVFVTYFKILKERPAGLMGATLEGLARYAHLINMDFFGDILVALKELIADANDGEGDDGDGDDVTPTRNTTRETLLCVITAFTLLSGQGEKMLNVDLTFFTSRLYATLLPLSLSADIEYSPKSLRLADPSDPTSAPPRNVNVATEIEMILRAIDSMFFQQQKGPASINPLRTAAFTKRMMVAALNMPEKSSLAVVGTVGRLMRKNQRKLASLFSTEDKVGDGVYRLEVDDPELSHPFAATVWETVLLRKHYSPKVAESAGALRAAAGKV